jgi:hypothetical protein
MIDNNEKNSAISDIVCTTIYLGIFVFGFLHCLVDLAFTINKKAENYILISTEQIYDIESSSSYKNRFIINKIIGNEKNDLNDFYEVYEVYTKNNNLNNFIRLKLPTYKTKDLLQILIHISIVYFIYVIINTQSIYH